MTLAAQTSQYPMSFTATTSILYPDSSRHSRTAAWAGVSAPSSLPPGISHPLRLGWYTIRNPVSLNATQYAVLGLSTTIIAWSFSKGSSERTSRIFMPLSRSLFLDISKTLSGDAVTSSDLAFMHTIPNLAPYLSMLSARMSAWFFCATSE